MLSILHWLDIGYRTHTDLSTSCTVSLFDSSCSKDRCSRREIRSFDDLHDFFDRGLIFIFNLVINDFHNCTDDFSQVVRRNIGCHTYRDTGGSVYQKVRESCRKYGRFFFCLVKVRCKINGIFIDIRCHFHRDLTKSCLGISHCGSAVTVHRTEVTVTVYKNVTGRPVLCHINKGSVNRTVTMWVIFTHGITDDTRAFTVRLVRTVVQLDHRIKNTSLNRFQTVSYIRKRTRSNNTHGIIDIELFHGFFHIHFMNFIKNIIFHWFSPIYLSS